MKKSLINPILTIVVLVLVGAMFVYFYVSLNHMDKRMQTIQTTASTNYKQTQSIVNFINKNISAQTNAVK